MSKTAAVWQAVLVAALTFAYTDLCFLNLPLFCHFLRKWSIWNSQEAAGCPISTYCICINLSLTNNAEAILEARLLQSKRPPDHTTKGWKRLQWGSNRGWDVTDGDIGTAIIYHNVWVEIIAGEIHWRRRVAHIYSSIHFTIHPLWLSCKNKPKPSKLVRATKPLTRTWIRYRVV